MQETRREWQGLSDDELDEYMHLFTINRDILMTPFHNMALMCPVTKESAPVGPVGPVGPVTP